MNYWTAGLGKLRANSSHIVQYERLRSGHFYADFRRDKRLYPEVYHCIIQREGSTEIISWSQHRDLDRARVAAQIELKRLVDGETLRTRTQA
jgi:hypothetical protein